MLLIDSRFVWGFDDDNAVDPTVENVPLTGIDVVHGLKHPLTFTREQLIFAYNDLLEKLNQVPDFKNHKAVYGLPLTMIEEDGEIVGCFAEDDVTLDGVFYYRDSFPFIYSEQRGKGLYGKAMEFWYRTRRPSVAYILDSNTSSIRMYEKLGFVKDRSEPLNGVEASIYYLK